MGCANKLNMVLIVLVLFCNGAFSQEGVRNELVQRRQLKDCLPSKVNELRTVVNLVAAGTYSRKPIDLNDVNIKRAREQASQWIAKTIRSDWLPADLQVLWNNQLMLRNAFGPNDVIYFRWVKDGRTFHVAQTETVILYLVQSVPPGQPAKVTTKARKSFARDVIVHFFTEQADVEVIEPTTAQIVKRQIIPTIEQASFDASSIEEYAGGICATCSGPSDESRGDFNRWWRRISWWTDGLDIGIYTLKTDGGAWEADYGATLDATWFEGPSAR